VRTVEVFAGYDPGGIAAKRTIVSDEMWPTLAVQRERSSCVSFSPDPIWIPRRAFAGSRFDGTWNVVFVTQRGACDPTYNFAVDVLNGSVTHPNILTFRGHVAPPGAVSRLDQSRTEIRVGIWQIVGSVGQGRLERPLG
jgi:hypothetical protein